MRGIYGIETIFTSISVSVFPRRENNLFLFQCTCIMLNKNSLTWSTWYLKRHYPKVFSQFLTFHLQQVASKCTGLAPMFVFGESHLHTHLIRRLKTSCFFLMHWTVFPNALEHSLLISTCLFHLTQVSMSLFLHATLLCIIFMWQLQCEKFLFTYLLIC